MFQSHLFWLAGIAATLQHQPKTAAITSASEELANKANV
jgi:hypothetical protein